MKIYSYDSKPKVPAPKPKKSFRKGWTLKRVFTWLFRLLAAGIILIAALFLYYSRDLPDPGQLLSRNIPQSTKIYARDGTLLYEIHGEVKRTLVTLNQISPYLPQATIAIEDKNFYKEGGISPTGIIRSAFVDLVTGSKSEGASTITQQFVKNALLTNQKSWDRKIREVILAISIDAHFSKDQILSFYLNEIPYGRNAYGAEAAAEAYFGVHASALDLAQSAYLASIPQAPTYYDPTGPNRAALDDRKNTVLEQMQEQGYITKAQMTAAENEKVSFIQATNSIIAPHFVLWIENYLAQKYGEQTLENGGLQVYTTLDPTLQADAEKAVANGVIAEQKRYNVNNAALVAMDPKTGQVLAMVGSANYFGTSTPAGCTEGKNCLFEPDVNLAISPRQPGSSFKPYVYVTAFSKPYDMTPATPLYDVVTDFGTYDGKDYIPHNYSGESNGLVDARKALAGSLNVPAVKVLDMVGVANAVQTAHNVGITSPLQDCGLSLVLGGCEVTLLDHVAGYSVFANSGVRNPETAILKILDANGNVLEQYQPNPQPVLDPQANYELINILTDNNARGFVFGLNSPLNIPGRQVAVKTGTTQNWHDGWTIGFTPSLVAGVWAGNNPGPGTPGSDLAQGADGVVVAAPIWHAFMVAALGTSTPETFPVPPGIQNVVVDNDSGLLPTALSPATHSDVFASYSVPTTYDNMHVSIPIDSTTGLPANNLTPPAQIIYKTCTIYKSEMPNNPAWEQPVELWASAQPNACPNSYTQTATSSPTTTVTGTAPTINIVDPADGSILFQLPIVVNVSVAGQNPIARVDLSIDGQFAQSKTSAPYTFILNGPFSVGQHVFAAKAVDTTGAEADTSVTITYNPNELTVPAQ
jgi:membrane peptidoglycan carboxypeptidase